MEIIESKCNSEPVVVGPTSFIIIIVLINCDSDCGLRWADIGSFVDGAVGVFGCSAAILAQ